MGKHMQTKLAVGIALACGIAIGAAGLDTLRAQTKTPPGYVVTEVEILDQALFKEFAAKTGATIDAHGGKRLVRGGAVTPLDGPPPKRVIINVFESVAKAKAWRDSPEWKAIEPLRAKSTKSRDYIVEGIAN
jgi:uncharacterized protein (DUF1330 family)